MAWILQSSHDLQLHATTNTMEDAFLNPNTVTDSLKYLDIYHVFQ